MHDNTLPETYALQIEIVQATKNLSQAEQRKLFSLVFLRSDMNDTQFIFFYLGILLISSLLF